MKADFKDTDCLNLALLFQMSVYFTFHISIPVFPVGQVHVDVRTQLWGAAAEHAEDFVLIKSRFLKTAHESSAQAPHHTPQYVTNPRAHDSD